MAVLQFWGFPACKTGDFHFAILGIFSLQETLREQGVLIFGTGNIVHNLRLAEWDKVGEGFDWAYEFDGSIHDSIMKKDHEKILKYEELGSLAKLAVPITDHFYPLLYALGASDEGDSISVYNRSCVLGSVMMTAYIWG
jgi:4,5-DOPA dioxygenase extradiol